MVTIKNLMITGNLSLGFMLVIKQCLFCVLLLSLFECSNHHNITDSNNEKPPVLVSDYHEEPVTDEFTMLPVFLNVDKQPKYKDGMMSLLEDFSSSFHHNYQDDEIIQTSVNVIFVIDTTGALIGERIKGKDSEDLTSFEKDVLNTIHALQSWTCGQINGKKVNVRVSFPIHVEPRLEP